ncbi:YbbR-like domain-containing protein [Mucilaginibacter myungsuensis]|uniref:YbbR-like domain-containing protein n=1 Tax=Mucilaginibacter myungsuensis TaxID=649104 RepID=A0A929L3E6_9SPHI|nr:YbbR-like domain-containing protein [Mucilaginibacter myungsuensis]MBE9662506.1 YbbR-like domain-containing protein [Mucilaginibacter myungsuensis]MDN3597925.1 YbbR-like domain-containing protein [Mucilaginibacter myungsuensis]
MPIIKLSAIERRRFSAFVSCFVIAVVAWVLVTLSGSYKYTIKQVVNFKNAPQRRAYHSLQSDTVDVTMMGTGWQMLFSGLQEGHSLINIDLHTLENRDFVVLNKQLEQINATKDTVNYVVSIDPDTLYFDFTSRTNKRVLVHLAGDISYQRGYFASDKILMKPTYVNISGSSARIKDIHEWPTDSLKLTDLNENYSTRIALKPVADGSLVIFPKQVEVKIPVDEYTEKVLEVPVKLMNQHYDNVKVFPQKVKVTFTVSLKKYAETNEEFFDANADLELWRSKGYSSLPVRLNRIPSYCKIVSVEPRNIDFIVKK